MATKTSPDQDNRIQEDYDAKFNEITKGFSSSSAGLSADDLQKLEEHANTGGEETAKDKNAGKSDDSITAARKKEETPWHTSYTTPEGKKEKITFKNFFKKKGPMGLIIGLLFGGGGAFTMMLSPGLGIVQLKEVMASDLNDQLAAMDTRDAYLMRTKLKKWQVGASICSDKISIRCKFSTLSKREIKKMKEHGFKFEPADADKSFGRLKPTKIIFPDGTEVTNPNELRNHLLNDVEARSAMRKAFNPKFAGLWDKVSHGVFARFKSNKATKVEGSTKEERDEAVTSATAGQSAGISAEGTLKDGEGREYVLDEDGNKVYKESFDNMPEGTVVDEGKFNEISEGNREKFGNIQDAAQTAESSGKSAAGSFLKSGLKGLNIAGAADTACSVYNMTRALAAAAKITRALQLFQFAMVFFNVADRIKAGVAQPEEVTYIGNNLTTVDTEKMIVDENSVKGEDGKPVPYENPNYGANAFDSPGYQVAAYNDAPILTSRDMQFMIGGGLTGTLSNVMDKILEILQTNREGIRKICSVVQSWWARSLGLIAGIVSAVGSGFTTLAISVGASIAIGFAMPYLEAMMADILAGKVVSAATVGYDAGDAIFAGAGALFGAMAMGHGLMPANKNQLKQYTALTNEVKADYIAVETYEARKTPFDINNQYSFLGSFVRKINPAFLQSNSISGALTSLPSLLSTAAASLIPHSSAYEVFNDDRFSKCDDQAYQEIGIDADVFCNVRYFSSLNSLAIEPDAAADWMIEKDHINEDGTPKSDKYKDWIKYCTEREDGWGETSDDEDNGDEAMGKACVSKDKDAGEIERLDYFAAFFMYYHLQDTRDEGYTTGQAGGNTGNQSSAATPEICKTMAADDLGQIACKAYQFDNYGYLWGGGHGGTAQGFMDAFNSGKYKAGQDSILDCSGLVRMSIFAATGVDIGGMGTSSYPGYSKFKKIDKTEAKAGDILYKPGHTEIIVSNDTAAQKYETFGAHTAKTSFNKQIGPSSYSYSQVTAVYRFQK